MSNNTRSQMSSIHELLDEAAKEFVESQNDMDVAKGKLREAKDKLRAKIQAFYVEVTGENFRADS